MHSLDGSSARSGKPQPIAETLRAECCCLPSYAGSEERARGHGGVTRSSRRKSATPAMFARIPNASVAAGAEARAVNQQLRKAIDNEGRGERIEGCWWQPRSLRIPAERARSRHGRGCRRLWRSMEKLTRHAGLAAFLTLAAATAQSAPTATSRPAPTGAREQAVLAILREVDADGRYAQMFWHRRKVAVPKPDQPPVPGPRRIGFCGNSITGWADKPALRARLVRLFGAFDLQAETNAACEVAGERTTFDVAHRDAKVAVRVEGERPAGEFWQPHVPPPDGRLGAERIAKIEAAGWRILCVSLGELSIHGRDEVGTLVPFLARVVELLDAATPGEDVDVAPLVRGWEQRWTLPALAKGLPATARFVEPTSVLEITAQTRLTWEIDAGAEVRDHADQSRWRKASTRGTTRGQVTMVALPVNSGWAGPGKQAGLTLRVTQGTLTVASRSPQILMPSSFDAGKPFTLTAEFGPGHYQVFPEVSVATVR
jgi:hypothetical protein